MKLFKPEDFAHSKVETIHSLIADLANLKLNQWLDAAPTVYGQGIGAMKSSEWNMNGPEFERYKHTHTAKILCIEEIKKECKHEPDLINQKIGGWFCKHCNAELVAEWRVK